MTSLAEVAQVARSLSRDFPTFFEENFPTLGATLRLPHPLVEPVSVRVVDNESGDEIAEVAVNGRNGLLKVRNHADYSAGVYVSGMYYQWFLDEDLLFFARLITNEHLYHRTGVTLDSVQGVEVEVMGIGALLFALNSLAAEFSTDIDVSSPEGLNIPAHQRYQQVMSYIAYWQEQYAHKAALLGVGLERIEMHTIRRVSRLTNRYVPIYRAREIDNPRPPVRIRPPIDPEETAPFEEEEAFWGANGVSTESWDFGYGGWNTMGTGG